MSDFTYMSADALARGYRAGEFSPVDVVQASLDRITAVDSRVNSMVTVTGESALESAREAESRFRSGEELPDLYGVPMTVKDLVDTAGVRTTYGAVTHQDHVPDEDALAWERLKAAGVILVGKSTTPEYGLLGITDSMLTGPTSTPWRIGHNAGGSSGGAAAGVAAGIVPIAWGSDGGGSIRVPAASCGVVGIKPSMGRIPHRDGSEPDETEGPITGTVLDAALVLDATVGRHILDRFSVPRNGEKFADAARLNGDLKGVRIAANVDYGQVQVNDEVRAAFEVSLDVLRSLGAEVSLVKIDLPDIMDYFQTYWGPECLAFVEEMDGLGADLWPMIRDVAEQAKSSSAITVSASMRSLKTRIYNAYVSVFLGHDLLVTPTIPFAALPHPTNLRDASVSMNDEERLNTLRIHLLTESPSHAWLPAVTVPNGFTELGLPVGLQFIAPQYEDSRAIYAAAKYEAATDWSEKRPRL